MIPFSSVVSSVLCALINTCTIPFKVRISGKVKVGNVSLSGISNFSFIRRELHTRTHTHTYVHAHTHTNMRAHTHQLFKNGVTTE